MVLNLSQALTSLRVHGRRPRIEVVDGSEARRFRSRSALGLEAAKELGCALVGIEVSPIYRDPETAEPYPAVLRILRRQLARALRRSLFQFVRSYTTHKPADFHALGRRAMTKSVWDVDQRLAEVSDHFDFILSLNPNNTEAAWRSFKKGRFDKAPVFRYSPLHFDPPLLKRKLFAIPLERIEDPTITELFREKQLELDRQLTVLGRPRLAKGPQQQSATLWCGEPGAAQAGRRDSRAHPQHHAFGRGRAARHRRVCGSGGRGVRCLP